LGKAPEMVGTLTMEVALNTVDGKPGPFQDDTTESVTVTLRMLVVQPSGMTPVTA